MEYQLSNHFRFYPSKGMMNKSWQLKIIKIEIQEINKAVALIRRH